jgi:Tol biopolymer transport system component
MIHVLLTLLLAQDAPGLREISQLTSGGTHAEAYWSPDGKKIVLMGERPGDPADQIYELEVASGALTRVSTGKGKAT